MPSPKACAGVWCICDSKPVVIPARSSTFLLTRPQGPQVALFTQGDAKMAARVKAVWNEAMANPETAPKLPLNPEIFTFVEKAWRAAEESGNAICSNSWLITLPLADARGRQSSVVSSQRMNLSEFWSFMLGSASLDYQSLGFF